MNKLKAIENWFESHSEAFGKAFDAVIFYGCKYIGLPVVVFCMFYALVVCVDAGAKVAKQVKPNIPVKITVEYR